MVIIMMEINDDGDQRWQQWWQWWWLVNMPLTFTRLLRPLALLTSTLSFVLSISHSHVLYFFKTVFSSWHTVVFHDWPRANVFYKTLIHTAAFLFHPTVFGVVWLSIYGRSDLYPTVFLCSVFLATLVCVSVFECVSRHCLVCFPIWSDHLPSHVSRNPPDRTRKGISSSTLSSVIRASIWQVGNLTNSLYLKFFLLKFNLLFVQNLKPGKA